MQPCVSFNKINTFEWYKKRVYEADNPEPDNFTQAMKLAMEWGDAIPIGIFYQTKKPDFTSRIKGLENGPLIFRNYDPEKARAILQDS